jgi:hypothetical protein
MSRAAQAWADQQRRGAMATTITAAAMMLLLYLPYISAQGDTNRLSRSTVPGANMRPDVESRNTEPTHLNNTTTNAQQAAARAKTRSRRRYRADSKTSKVLGPQDNASGKAREMLRSTAALISNNTTINPMSNGMRRLRRAPPQDLANSVEAVHSAQDGTANVAAATSSNNEPEKLAGMLSCEAL